MLIKNSREKFGCSSAVPGLYQRVFQVIKLSGAPRRSSKSEDWLRKASIKTRVSAFISYNFKTLKPDNFKTLGTNALGVPNRKKHL